MLPAATRAKAPNPLVALKTRRKQALAAMGALSAAIGKDTLDRAKDLAQDAASRLAALPGACGKAKHHLMLRLIRKTKAVPKSHIKATSTSRSPAHSAVWPRPCKATPYGPSSTRW